MGPVVETGIFIGGPNDGARHRVVAEMSYVSMPKPLSVLQRVGKDVAPTRSLESTVYRRETLSFEDGPMLTFYVDDRMTAFEAIMRLFTAYEAG